MGKKRNRKQRQAAGPARAQVASAPVKVKEPRSLRALVVTWALILGVAGVLGGLAAAFDVYEKVFGAAKTSHDAAWSRYDMEGGGSIALPPHWHVLDVDTLRAKSLQQNGVDGMLMMKELNQAFAFAAGNNGSLGKPDPEIALIVKTQNWASYSDPNPERRFQSAMAAALGFVESSLLEPIFGVDEILPAGRAYKLIFSGRVTFGGKSGEIWGTIHAIRTPVKDWALVAFYEPKDGVRANSIVQRIAESLQLD